MNEISVTQALNQIQSWLNKGEYEKVIQGCQEILMLEPGNVRALTLMKKAEEDRYLESRPAPEPMPEAEPEPTSSAPDPLADLQVEEPISTPLQSAAPTEPEEHHIDDHLGGPIEKRKLFLAMVVPAVLVVLIGSAIIWALANRERATEIEDATDEPEVVEEEEADRSYIEHNEERVLTLTEIGKMVEDYYEENEEYPAVDDLEELLLDSLDELPEDPRQGEQDSEDEDFGYIYAVFEDADGNEAQYYSISALFEDSKGKGYAWNRGTNPRHFPDFRDWEEDHVFLIGEE